MRPPLLLIVLFFFGNSITARPTPAISLNGVWQFKTDLYKVGEEQKWYAPGLETAGWDEMKVPGVWDIRNEYADYAGTAWYRKTFTADSDWEQKWVRLIFQAVYNDVKVWLNGEYLGDHHVGFLPFHFDIADHLRYGEENTIALSVDNTFKRGAIWNWGGIRRPVWLEVTDKVRLEQQHITAIPDLEVGTAEIRVDFKVSNFGDEAVRVNYELHLAKAGQSVWDISGKAPLQIPAGETREERVSFTLPADKVHLWHFNSPHLYEAELTLTREGNPVHYLKDRFGIRKIEVEGLELKLNGESVRPVGFNIVAEDRTTGNTLPLWRIKQDVDMLKQLGVNMARLNHLPLPEEFLDYLDEKGIMTFEEVSLWGKDIMVDPEHPLPKYWLEKMIETKYNHPSVIGWSVGNEIGYLNVNPKVMEYVAGAIEHAKEQDPTRLAVYVSHSADKQEVDPVQYADMILLNKYGSWGEPAEKAHQLHPGKPIFYSEYGKELNSEDPNQSYIDAKGMLDEMRGKPYLIGGSLWTFNDYRSFWKAGPTWTTPPSQNRTWGIVNVHRQKKKSYYIYRREYAPVKELNVDWNEETQQADITIKPRGRFDIPAYPLEGYRLLWTLRGEDQELTEGGFMELPLLRPGDAGWRHSVSLTQEGAHLKVELLDPQGYSVRDTSIYQRPPRKPEIRSVHTASRSVRIVFEQVPDAKFYKLRYGKGELIQETGLTINDFVEVDDLEYDKTYQFAVVAVNDAGESPPSEIHEARTDEDELPPIIWKTTPADGAFFIGYSVGRTDYLYEIEYGQSPGQYEQRIALRNVGVCQIPGLENGTTYYYRLRRRMQWGFASEWTGEHSVRPDGGLKPAPPSTVEVIRKGKNAMILFEPVEKATGYQLRVEDIDTGFYKDMNLTSVLAGHFYVEDLEEGKSYRFSLRTQNENGFSDWETAEEYHRVSAGFRE